MRVEVDSYMVTVTLSHSNLLALLHKLEKPNSARTINRWDGANFLTVKVETDADHYHNRTRGVMTADTEDSMTRRKNDEQY